MIKCVAISDTHNTTDGYKVPEGDILFHTGDFTKIGLEKEIIHFNNFLGTLNFKHIVVIAGNHDLGFDKENKEELREKVKDFVRIFE